MPPIAHVASIDGQPDNQVRIRVVRYLRNSIGLRQPQALTIRNIRFASWAAQKSS